MNRLLILLLFIASTTFAQKGSMFFGIDMGTLTMGVPSQQIEIFKTNHEHPEADLKQKKLMMGFDVGLKYDFEKTFLDFHYKSKWGHSNKSNAFDVDGEKYLAKYKTKVSSFGVAFGAGNDKVKAGLSWDIGAYKLKKKEEPEASFKSGDFSKMNKTNIFMGSSLIVIYTYGVLELRGYYQFSYTPLKRNDEINYPNNVGISVNVCFGEDI